MALCWAAYLGAGDAAQATLAAAGDLAAAPPAWIAIAAHDPLRDDGLAHARALRGGRACPSPSRSSTT